MASTNAERRPVICRCTDLGAHLPQGRDNPAHRAAGKRFVSVQLTREIMPCENAGEHAHGRSRVAAVQTFLRLLKTLTPFNLKCTLYGALHIAAKLAHAA